MLACLNYFLLAAIFAAAAPIHPRSESSDIARRSRSLSDLSGGEIAGMIIGIVLGVGLSFVALAQCTNGSLKIYKRYQQRKADAAEMAVERAGRALVQGNDRASRFIASSSSSSALELPSTPVPAYYVDPEPKCLNEAVFTGAALRPSFELPPPAYLRNEAAKKENENDDPAQ